MSESVYGVELPTLRDAIAAHELQGYEDLGPYIFTKVSKKKKGTSSSGFGPGQITASTAEDMLARYPSLFDDEFVYVIHARVGFCHRVVLTAGQHSR